MSRDGRVNVDELVRDALVRILRESGQTVPVLSDDVRLDELGVTSLDLTTIIVELTGLLGIDDDGRAEAEIATVGDLRRVFAPAGDRAVNASDPLAATRRRAEARRAGGR